VAQSRQPVSILRGPPQAFLTVKATSVADPTKSATATVTVQQAQTVQVTVSPTKRSLQSGQAQQFTATVTGPTNTPVTWTATGGPLPPPDFTPLEPPRAHFQVTANRLPTSTKSSTVSVVIVPGVSVKLSRQPRHTPTKVKRGSYRHRDRQHNTR